MYRDREDRVRVNNAEVFQKISRFVKSIDSKHLTSVHIDSKAQADYKDSADIIEAASHDSYTKRNLIPQIIEDVDEVRNALGESKPFVFWIGASLPSARTAEEIRCASYLALMHGAAGIVFHMGHEGIDPSLTRHWSVYTGLSREIERFFPILTAPQLPNSLQIAVQPDGILDFAMRNYKDRTYVFAANTSDRLITANISIADRSVGLKNIRLLFENRDIIPEGSGFTDVFTPFEPHVYEFVLARQLVLIPGSPGGNSRKIWVCVPGPQ